MKRRKFLEKTMLGLGAVSIVPRYVLGGEGFTAPSDQLTKAVIGVGGMGRHHLQGYPGAKLLAVCDVDRRHLQIALDQCDPEVKGYTDFREVLERKDIDVVHIPTPPHWHALISIAAAKAGKDIWCEKPMTRTIGEGQKVVEAVQKYDRMFRINTWFRFQGGFYGMDCEVKPIKKIVENGLLGWPLKINVSATTGFEWKFFWSGQTGQYPEWIPEELDYNMWLGPAPYKPYHHHRVHGTFRGYWDYDGGGLGDMGQHFLDPVQYLLDKDDTSPVEIEADAPQQHPDACGSWRRIWMKYEDGCEILLDGVAEDENVPFIEGPQGKLYPGLRTTIANLQQKIKSLPDPKPQPPDFYDSVRNRQKFALNEANAHRSCSLVNLAKIAVRTGRKLRFDPQKQRFIDDEQANRFIDEPMRAPWRL
jgi:myo-inositol 2-dehydrogenase/D-chiro-inositol 1-dehydrogenase